MAGPQKSILAGIIETASPRLAEWIAYHRAMGFDQIVLVVPRDILADNPFLKALNSFDWCQLVPLEVAIASRYHRRAMRKLKTLPELKDAGWVLFLGTSEFLCIQKGAGTLASLLGTLGKADAISISARSFGPIEPTDRIPQNLTGTITHCQSLAQSTKWNQHLRCLYRPDSFAEIGKHRPIARSDGPGVRWYNGAGKRTKYASDVIGWAVKGDFLTYEMVQINVYRAPGLPEFLQNMEPEIHASKDVSHHLELLQTQWHAFSQLTAEKDKRARNRWEKTQGVLTEMRSENMDFATAEEELWAKYREKSHALLQSPLGQKFAKWLDEGAVPPIIKPTKDKEKTPSDQTRSDMGAVPETPALWIQDIFPGGNIRGTYTRLENHALSMVERSTEQLWISFDNLGPVNDKSIGRDPWAYKFIRDLGQSHLGVFALRKDWYRDPEFIDALRAQAKSVAAKEYEQIILTGTSMGAFAALAFAPLFPGCRVIAFNPQSTLDEAIVPWETRYGMGRAQDWTLPFSDAAEGSRAASRSYIFYDPYMALDKKHLRRLTAPNVMVMETWYSNHFSPVLLRRMNQLKPVMSACGNGTMTKPEFYRLYRDRRHLPWYMRALTKHAQTRNHPKLEARIRPAFQKLRKT